ncbi:uncharacterized protein BKA78DRAFT_304689 [Phyllosticta capitalensis]|uniref:uncharacterized protein n=1 Tax=Phyllosticta capitalensis TaxID=121624 RepID=UPI00312E0453
MVVLLVMMAVTLLEDDVARGSQTRLCASLSLSWLSVSSACWMVMRCLACCARGRLLAVVFCRRGTPHLCR